MVDDQHLGGGDIPILAFKTSQKQDGLRFEPESKYFQDERQRSGRGCRSSSGTSKACANATLHYRRNKSLGWKMAAIQEKERQEEEDGNTHICKNHMIGIRKAGDVEGLESDVGV